MRIQGFPYEYFDGIDCYGVNLEVCKDKNFIKTFLVEKKSFVVKYDNTLSFDKASELKALIDKHNSEIRNIKGKSEADKNKRNELNGLLKEKIGQLSDDHKIILAHAIWLWAFPYVKYQMKQALEAGQYDISLLKLNEEVWKNDSAEGISSIGSSGSVRIAIIPQILSLFEEVAKMKNPTSDSVKEKLREQIKDEKKPCSTFNAILHFLDPQKVEAIVSSDEKDAIVKAFKWVDGVTGTEDIDIKLKKIRDFLKTQNSNFKSFYSDSLIRSLWRTEKLNVEEMTRVQQLEYKKAMVLYGPPGTGKSYAAEEIVKQLVFNYYMRNNKDELKKCLASCFDWKKHYASKQFHVNYSYEDFVGGITINNGSAIFKRGFIFEACKKAADLEGAPYVVILDEINRADVSRVFGEVFTAMEPDKRGKDYPIAVLDENGNSVSINIPSNLYFIGTMNEIDFSLERIDFALRRRFVWNYCGFDKEALIDIINDRDKNLQSENVSLFADRCIALNNVITSNKELGKLYEIGHAFFADITFIYNDLKDWDKARKVLWSISIKPTLDAYCGSMDERAMDNFLKDCAVAFGVKYKSLFENNDSEQYEEI